MLDKLNQKKEKNKQKKAQKSEINSFANSGIP